MNSKWHWDWINLKLIIFLNWFLLKSLNIIFQLKFILLFPIKFESILAIRFETTFRPKLSIFSFIKWLEKKNIKWLISSGILLGLTVYAYNTPKLFLPMIVLAILILWYRQFRANLRFPFVFLTAPVTPYLHPPSRPLPLFYFVLFPTHSLLHFCLSFSPLCPPLISLSPPLLCVSQWLESSERSASTGTGTPHRTNESRQCLPFNY